MSKLLFSTCCLVLSAVVLIGCNRPVANSTPEDSESGQQRWVATTGHIADALRQISAGTGAEVKLLCGPGIDPHSFSASTRDVQAMADADAIFYNGFHLEAKLHDFLVHQFADKSWSMASAFPQEARLDWVEDGQIDPEAPFDPHIWNHLPGWSACVSSLIDQLCVLDPANAETYRENGASYVAEIDAMHQTALQRFESIPEERRVLVSAHDAFNYFAKVYHFKTVAVLGIGNDAEADVKTMREVATTICDQQVPVIFLETITNPKVTTALQDACAARQWSVTIADQPLYSDDLGSESPTDTFLGAFESNVKLIAESLSSG